MRSCIDSALYLADIGLMPDSSLSDALVLTLCSSNIAIG